MPILHLAFPKISSSRTDAVVRDEWVASEKIHGAQLVVGIQGDEIRVGKRKAWLNEDEAFFGWQMLRPLLHGAARAIQRDVDPTGMLWIYGELFGGRYPHASTPAVPGLVPVQTGIWYAPDLQYAVFDIVHEAAGAERVFLADERVRELAASAGLRTAPLLGRGKFGDLDRLPVRFQSLVPKLLGLAGLPQNLAEGYVLKHAHRAPVTARPAAKRKIAEFDEQRFDESHAFDPNAHLSSDELFALAARLVNGPRIASARSKVGTDDERVIEEVVLDAMIDLHEILPRRASAMAPGEEQGLTQHLREHARRLVSSSS